MDTMFLKSLIPHVNGKLLDYDDPETGIAYRYAQFNTRAVKDCPFRSAGCEAVCYATKGNHVFPSVKTSRENSYNDTKRADFVDAMVYTIKKHLTRKRYKGAVMILRLHESGDFYSLPYLRNWVRIWEKLEPVDGWQSTLYTKCFVYFNLLTDDEKAVVNRLLASGKLSINLSLDDTTTERQKVAYLECIANFPKANTYYCTEDVSKVAHDTVCDCADCAKCGTCNKAQGKRTVVKIHSASKSDMETYRENIA